MSFFSKKPPPIPQFKVGEEVLHSDAFDACTGPVGPHWNHRRHAVIVTTSIRGSNVYYDIKYDDGSYWATHEGLLTKLGA